MKILLTLVSVLFCATLASAQPTFQGVVTQCAAKSANAINCSASTIVNVDDDVFVALTTFRFGSQPVLNALGTAGVVWTLDADKYMTEPYSKWKPPAIRAMFYRGRVTNGGTVTGLTAQWGGPSAPIGLTAVRFSGVGVNVPYISPLTGEALAFGGVGVTGYYTVYTGSGSRQTYYTPPGATDPVLIWEAYTEPGSLHIGSCGALFDVTKDSFVDGSSHVFPVAGLTPKVGTSGGSATSNVTNALGWHVADSNVGMFQGICDYNSRGAGAGAGVMYLPQ